MQATNAQEVMVSIGTFEERVVYTSKHRPQIGYINYQGKKQKVFVGFWGDCPVWKLLRDSFDEQEYDYCAQKTMAIDDDPDYCGSESTEGAASVTILVRRQQ